MSGFDVSSEPVLRFWDTDHFRTYLDERGASVSVNIHALAALQLGAERVVAVDIDSESVATTNSVLERHAPAGSWECHEASVFDLDPAGLGQDVGKQVHTYVGNDLDNICVGVTGITHGLYLGIGKGRNRSTRSRLRDYRQRAAPARPNRWRALALT